LLTSDNISLRDPETHFLGRLDQHVEYCTNHRLVKERGG
jgi:hypothetical protein